MVEVGARIYRAGSAMPWLMPLHREIGFIRPRCSMIHFWKANYGKRISGFVDGLQV